MSIRRWAAPLIFGAHALDECASGFPAWATRNFGATTRHFYLISHTALIAGVIFAASRRDAQPELLGSVASGFVANGLFHLRETTRLDEPSPGSLTATTLLIPGGVWLLVDLLLQGDLGVRALGTSVAGGISLNAAAVGSLRLEMPTLERGRGPSRA